jgi:hypothetical protein
LTIENIAQDAFTKGSGDGELTDDEGMIVGFLLCWLRVWMSVKDTHLPRSRHNDWHALDQNAKL